MGVAPSDKDALQSQSQCNSGIPMWLSKSLRLCQRVNFFVSGHLSFAVHTPFRKASAAWLYPLIISTAFHIVCNHKLSRSNVRALLPSSPDGLPMTTGYTPLKICPIVLGYQVLPSWCWYLSCKAKVLNDMHFCNLMVALNVSKLFRFFFAGEERRHAMLFFQVHKYITWNCWSPYLPTSGRLLFCWHSLLYTSVS